jgi:hypothetical protein
VIRRVNTISLRDQANAIGALQELFGAGKPKPSARLDCLICTLDIKVPCYIWSVSILG